MKAQPVKKFDQNNLHRHADFAKPEAVKEQHIPVPATAAASTVSRTESTESFEDFLGGRLA